MTLISLDTETTGLDLHHGAKPFLVTTCDEEGVNRWWEWYVDPRTRQPKVPAGDIDEILGLLIEAVGKDGQPIEWVLQNAKFDVQALCAIDPRFGALWPWDRTHDTLLSGHLLASNQPHDLTSMAVIYLGTNLEPYEERMKVAVNEARALAARRFPKWRTARKDDPMMPSAKEKVWKYDCWLPRYLARKLGYLLGHPWWDVTAEYANSDSTSTLALHLVHQQKIAERGLQPFYEERRRLLPIVYRMEARGVSLNAARLEQLMLDYQEEAQAAEQRCVSIAAKYGCELTLPKSGNNKSLLEFVFGPLGLKASKRSGKTGKPSMDKGVIEQWEATLEPGDQLTFVQSLKAKRKRDTALGYLASYKKFWVPLGIYNEHGEQLWYRLHPGLNITATDTLRWSSSNPNEQNISKQEGFNLRYCFGPLPGREWWSCDAKNIELRIPAYESGQQELITLFEQPDEPPYYGSTHLLNFHTVYPDIWAKELKAVGLEEVGPHCKKKYASTWYQWCKNGGFAVQYGAIEKTGVGEMGTADKAFHRPGSHAKLKKRFAKLAQHNQRCIDFANIHGYIETMPDRTVDPERGYPLLCTNNKWGRGVVATIPLNYRTQGTAMWWMAKAMVRCDAFLQRLNSGLPTRKLATHGFYMIMQVHDELVFDFPKGKGRQPWRTNLPKVRKLMELMEQGGKDLGLPTPVSCEYHPDNWSEGISI